MKVPFSIKPSLSIQYSSHNTTGRSEEEDLQYYCIQYLLYHMALRIIATSTYPVQATNILVIVGEEDVFFLLC